MMNATSYTTPGWDWKIRKAPDGLYNVVAKNLGNTMFESLGHETMDSALAALILGMVAEDTRHEA